MIRLADNLSEFFSGEPPKPSSAFKPSEKGLLTPAKLEAIRFEYEKRRFPTIVAVAISYVPVCAIIVFLWMRGVAADSLWALAEFCFAWGDFLPALFFLGFWAMPLVVGILYLAILRKTLYNAPSVPNVSQKVVTGKAFLYGFGFIFAFTGVLAIIIALAFQSTRRREFPILPDEILAAHGAKGRAKAPPPPTLVPQMKRFCDNCGMPLHGLKICGHCGSVQKEPPKQ